MKRGRKVLLVWSCLMLVVAGLVFGQQHQQVPWVSFFGISIELLIGLISIVLIIHEPNRKNKFLFLNFAIFFCLSILYVISNLLQPLLFSVNSYLPYEVTQYVKGTNYAVLAFAIVYLVLDSLFRNLSVLQKYLASTVIVGTFFVLYFGNFMVDPKYGYATADVQDFRVVDRAYSQLLKTNGKAPTPEQLSERITLPAWKDNEPVGKLYAENNLRRITEISAYLPGDNYNVLLYKPINLYIIKMSVVSCFFILLFFGYQYRKDPPQGAYIDKIMFLLLLFCSLEIFHAWNFIHAVEWEELMQIFVVAQYITIFILILIAMFFGLRLRFVTSVTGEFYENELVHSAQHITRWRDWLDNIVLHYFFNPKAVTGVFFSQRPKK